MSNYLLFIKHALILWAPRVTRIPDLSSSSENSDVQKWVENEGETSVYSLPCSPAIVKTLGKPLISPFCTWLGFHHLPVVWDGVSFFHHVPGWPGRCFWFACLCFHLSEEAGLQPYPRDLNSESHTGAANPWANSLAPSTRRVKENAIAFLLFPNGVLEVVGELERWP